MVRIRTIRSPSDGESCQSRPVAPPTPSSPTSRVSTPSFLDVRRPRTSPARLAGKSYLKEFVTSSLRINAACLHRLIARPNAPASIQRSPSSTARDSHASSWRCQPCAPTYLVQEIGWPKSASSSSVEKVADMPRQTHAQSNQCASATHYRAKLKNDRGRNDRYTQPYSLRPRRRLARP